MNLYKSFKHIVFTLLGVAFIITGCDVNDSTVDETGQLSVQLTDAPGDYDAVYIDIQSVRIKPADVEEDKETENGDDEGWITLNDDPVRVDLLELRNGDTIQLGEHELGTGMYNQIRLVLGPDNEVVVNGETYALTTPSAQQSGLKLNINTEIEEGERYNLLIDFNAGRSIVETGNQKYILKPVLRAVNLEETGSISGTVQPADFQTSVMAIMNEDTLSTITDTDGTFTIAGVTQGTYDVVFQPNSNAYSDTTITDVAVDFDEDVDLGTITLKE